MGKVAITIPTLIFYTDLITSLNNTELILLTSDPCRLTFGSDYPYYYNRIMHIIEIIIQSYATAKKEHINKYI